MILDRFRNRWVIFWHDVLWVPVAITIAYWVRFNLGGIPDVLLDHYYLFLAMAIPAHALAFWVFGCYRGVWRYASVPDLMRLALAVGLGLSVSLFGLFLLVRLDDIPRSAILLYPILLLCGTGGARIVYRAFKDHGLSFEFDRQPRALIVGAGRAGEMLVRDLRRNGPYKPVALLDDDDRKHGQELHGVRIRGSIDTLPEQARSVRADIVLIAMPSTSGEIIERIVSMAINSKLEVATLPALTDLEAPGASSQKLRPITVEDLLGRDPVDLHDKTIDEVIRQHNVLVTGGGGSIGSELCRQVAAHLPRRLIVFDHSEFNLYKTEMELREAFPDLPVHGVLGSVTDRFRLDSCMRNYEVDMVFHAAAYKHVPMVEENPCEGVRNNVIGTRVVADCAIRNNIAKFVLISTDKVVNPTSVMGASKRAAELYCQSLGSSSGTQFITTRFGNVLGSCGSVVPLFEQQIRNGGPVTVTDPDITRYFMTIGEAAQLILQASAIGNGGEIFVMDMGKPVRIVDLAEKMIRLHGATPTRDIEIEFTGLRPGEKLHEELFYEQEELVGTSHPKLLLANSFPASRSWLEGELHALEHVVEVGDQAGCLASLARMVPGFRPYQFGQDEEQAMMRTHPSLRIVK